MSSKHQSGEGKPVIVFQHSASEGIGAIENALRAESVQFEYVRSFEGQPIPKAIEGYSALIVMGGPMGVYETARYPFLISELSVIERFLKARRPILGICLGSQLLAACLGAKVRRGEKKEIGWYSVGLTAEGQQDALWKGHPEYFTAFHWHGDVFELPVGTAALASSEITPVQAYHYGRCAYGLLFHLEVTESHIRKMLREFADEIRQQDLDPRTILRDCESFLPSLQGIGGSVFRRWAKYI